MEAAAKWKPKDPKDIADYAVKWKPAGKPFLPPGVFLMMSVATLPAVQPPPGPGYAPLAIDDQDFEDTKSIVRFSGGTDKQTYPIEFDIDLSTGEHFNVTIMLQVKERIKT